MSYRPTTSAAAAAAAVVMQAIDRLPTPDRLLALRSVSVLLGSKRAATVVAARAEGFSWAEIADRLGMSRQSVWERYGNEGGDVPPSARGRRHRDRGGQATFSSCAAYKAVSSRPGPIPAPPQPDR